MFLYPHALEFSVLVQTSVPYVRWMTCISNIWSRPVELES